MKYNLSLFLLLLFLFSCQKEDFNEEIPDWLQPQIEELENSGECYGCTITKISFNNSIYYHFYCGHWSCLYCILYDINGNIVEWDIEDFNDFLEYKTDETIIWRCSDN